MAEPTSLQGMDRIPDPAASLAARPAPPAVIPGEPSPTRADRARRRVFALLAAFAWIAAVVALAGARPDLGSPAALAPIVAWTLAGALALVAVLRPRHRGLPPSVRVVQHALWVVPALFVALAIASGRQSGEPPFAWATVRGCLAFACAVMLGPLLAAALLLRGSFLSASAWRGAAVGALAGLAGAIGVHAHCPIPALDHLLGAHGPSIAVGAILGALLGRMRGRA